MLLDIPQWLVENFSLNIAIFKIYLPIYLPYLPRITWKLKAFEKMSSWQIWNYKVVEVDFKFPMYINYLAGAGAAVQLVRCLLCKGDWDSNSQRNPQGWHMDVSRAGEIAEDPRV